MIWLLIILVEYLLLSSQTVSSVGNNSEIAIIIFLVMCLQIVTFKICDIPLISFYAFFVVLLYLFHFGQLFCMPLVDDSMFSVINMIRYRMGDGVAAQKTIIISAMSINGVFMGGLLTKNLSNNLNLRDNEKNEDNVYFLRVCYSFAKISFLISFPFRLYIDIRQFIEAFSGGYSSAREITVSGVISCIAGFWYVSVALFAICIKSSRTRRIVTYSCLMYMFITMLSGGRGHQLVNIIGILVVLYYRNKTRIKPSTVIKYSTLGFVVLTLLNVILIARRESIQYLFGNFSLILSTAIKNNVVIQTLTEMGATIRTPYLVVFGKGNLFNPFFGETFFRSLLACIPGIDYFIPNTQSAIFSRALNSAYHITGLGGSFVGEMYYDFGGLYWLFSIIVGYIHCSLSSKTIQCIKNNKYREICLYLPFLIYSLWWTRDTFCGLARSVIWLLLLYFIILSVCSRKRKA